MDEPGSDISLYKTIEFKMKFLFNIYLIKRCTIIFSREMIYIYVITDIKFLVILMNNSVLHEYGMYINVYVHCLVYILTTRLGKPLY